MTTETFLASLGVVVALLTLAVVVLSGYLGYLAQSLSPNLERKVEEEVEEATARTERMVASHLVLIEMSLEILGMGADVGVPGGSSRGDAYALRQLARLASGNEGEIEKGLAALEALGSESLHLLPYAERLRNAGTWPRTLEDRFEEILRELRRSRRSAS